MHTHNVHVTTLTVFRTVEFAMMQMLHDEYLRQV